MSPLHLVQFKIDLTQDRVDRYTIVEPGVAIRPAPRLLMAVLPVQGRIHIQQGRQGGPLRDLRAILMLREHSGTGRVKTAEMEEDQRLTVHRELRASSFQLPGMNIPIGDVVGLIIEDNG